MKSLNFLRGSRGAIKIIISLVALLAMSNAQAVLLGLVPDPVPDAKSRNTIDYYYTNGSDSSGGFTMEIRGLVTGVSDNSGLENVSGGACAGGLGCYTLDASFNSGGEFQSGTINLTGTTAGGQLGPLNSGTLVQGNLTDFGWGGMDESGLFEFIYDFTGGDFSTVWGATNGGTVIDTRELAFGAGLLGTCNGADQSDCYDLGDWDASGLMTQEFSTAQPNGIFLSGLTTSDTFVPVPAAIWLFGSALGYLALMRRRALQG